MSGETFYVGGIIDRDRYSSYVSASGPLSTSKPQSIYDLDGTEVLGYRVSVTDSREFGSRGAHLRVTINKDFHAVEVFVPYHQTYWVVGQGALAIQPHGFPNNNPEPFLDELKTRIVRLVNDIAETNSFYAGLRAHRRGQYDPDYYVTPLTNARVVEFYIEQAYMADAQFDERRRVRAAIRAILTEAELAMYDRTEHVFIPSKIFPGIIYRLKWNEGVYVFQQDAPGKLNRVGYMCVTASTGYEDEKFLSFYYQVKLDEHEFLYTGVPSDNRESCPFSWSTMVTGYIHSHRRYQQGA